MNTLNLLNATCETLYMVGLSTTIAILLGVPFGVMLFAYQSEKIFHCPALYKALSVLTNAIRSVPFIILLIAIIPFTRLIVGTSIGTTAAIVPLSLGAIPFLARLVETSLQELPTGLIEAGLAMGASKAQILLRILLPEAMPNIIKGITLMIITLVGYSAMAGAVGGGGLGALAINYGYQRFDSSVMVSTVLLLIVLVQFIQSLGDYCARRLAKL